MLSRFSRTFYYFNIKLFWKQCRTPSYRSSVFCGIKNTIDPNVIVVYQKGMFALCSLTQQCRQCTVHHQRCDVFSFVLSLATLLFTITIVSVVGFTFGLRFFHFALLLLVFGKTSSQVTIHLLQKCRSSKGRMISFTFFGRISTSQQYFRTFIRVSLAIMSIDFPFGCRCHTTK